MIMDVGKDFSRAVSGIVAEKQLEFLLLAVGSVILTALVITGILYFSVGHEFIIYHYAVLIGIYGLAAVIPALAIGIPLLAHMLHAKGRRARPPLTGYAVKKYAKMKGKALKPLLVEKKEENGKTYMVYYFHHFWGGYVSVRIPENKRKMVI